MGGAPKAGSFLGDLRFPASITDGTSNTIWVVEAGSPVPWTKPQDLPYVADQALPRLGGLFGGDFNALFMDGTVHLISKNADETNLRRAITVADGEVIDSQKLFVPPEGSRPGGGKADLTRLPRDNARLKEAVEATLKEVDQTKEDVAVLKARLAEGVPTLDAKAVKLMKENAELLQRLQKAMEDLDALKAEKARLEKELQKLAPKKE
jgi:hypothetical protein